MFKRTTWLTVGFGLGVGTTVAAARQVRKRVNRYQPQAVANRMTDSLSSLRDQPVAGVPGTPKPVKGGCGGSRYDLSHGGAPNG
jgi:hypothetical protein